MSYNRRKRPGHRWPAGWVDGTVRVATSGVCVVRFPGLGWYRTGSKVTVIPRGDAEAARQILWDEWESLDPAAGEG